MALSKDKLAEFLYASINDAQSTIRAVDFKVSVLMLVLTIPLTQIPSIFLTIYTLTTSLCDAWLVVAVLLVGLFLATWLFSLTASLKSIIAIDNPVSHIKGGPKEGSFYSAALFRTGFIDSVWNRCLQSKRSVQEHHDAMPSDDDALVMELTFEQMKLVYIRSVKLERQKYAFISAAIWFVSGAAIWFWKMVVTFDVLP